MANLVKKIQNTIFQHNLFERGDKIILAVSGGPDSVCLLNIFSKLKKKYDLELMVAHVNYDLRENDSEADEKLVKHLVKEYEIKIYTLSPALSRQRARGNKQPSENELRNIRYAFFEKLRKKFNFDSIAIAHNLDDQAETFLLHLIRGAGLQGLSGMQYKNKALIRPLLGITREEIMHYLKENRLKYRIDKSNLEPRYLRNKIRLKLIPNLEKNFNPDIKKTLSASAFSIAADYAYIAEQIKKAHKKDTSLNISSLISLPSSFQQNVLRQKIQEIKHDLKDVSAAHIQEILKIARSNKSKNSYMKFNGLKITKIGDRLEIEKA